MVRVGLEPKQRGLKSTAAGAQITPFERKSSRRVSLRPPDVAGLE